MFVVDDAILITLTWVGTPELALACVSFVILSSTTNMCKRKVNRPTDLDELLIIVKFVSGQCFG